MSFHTYIKQILHYCPSRNLLTLLFCISLFPLFFSQPCDAKNDRVSEKHQIEEGIQQYRINIRKLKDGITEQQNKIQSSKEQKHSLLDELSQIETRLALQLEKLNRLEEETARQKRLINTKEQELQKSYASKQVVLNHLQTRIKSYYKMGEIGIANVAFSTENMSNMLQFRDSFTSLLNYDKNLIQVYRNSIAKSQQSKDTLNLQKGILDDFIAIAREDQVAMRDIKLEKETLLNQIGTRKDLHERAVLEMEKVANNLSNSLNALKREDELFDQGFLTNKGQHPPPLAGKIITLFGQKHKNRLGIEGKTSGITIATKGINRVTAIFEGKIRYADYLHGYGNTIIVDHGYQYFSVISRLEKLIVKEGDTVNQGEVVALTGDTATLMEEGIYLEIRLGSTPLNPLLWLDKKSLILP